MARIIVLMISSVILSCGPTHTAFHHSPFARTSWNPITPTQFPGKTNKATPAATTEDDADVRQRMVEQANSVLNQGGETPGYGAGDLEAILAAAGVDAGWRAENGLDVLVAVAKKRDAFKTDNDPEFGDVVLFHNQVDANGNGKLDDWLTGCGVVTKTDGPKFEAVVRTGHAPRKITVWPDGPGRNYSGDEQTNSYLRVPNRSDPEDTMYLAGQLFAGYIDIEKLASGL